MFTCQTGNFDIQKQHINGKGLFVITSGTDNYGIAGKSDVNAKVFSTNTITVDMFGNVYFRDFPYKMVTHARVFSLEVVTEINNKMGLYLQSSLSGLNKTYSYGNMCSYEKIKHDKILLPIRSGIIDQTNKYNDDGQIPNWDYMERHITRIENEIMARVTKYLAEAGLDKPLAEGELQVLSEEREYIEFKVVRVFDVKNTHSILAGDVEFNSGTIPYVTAGEGDNSIKSYIDCDKTILDEGNCIVIGGKTMVITYQEKDFCSNDSHNLSLTLRDNEIKKQSIQLFLVSTLNNNLRRLYSWGDSISKIKIQSDTILLPIQDNVTDFSHKYHDEGYVPDWDYMERYMDVLMRQTAARVTGMV